MFTLAAGETLYGVAGTAISVSYTITGDEKTTSDSFKVLAQARLPFTVGVIYTAPVSTAVLIQKIFLKNTTGGSVTVAFSINGTAGGNQIFSGTIPANGSALYGATGWQVYDSNGVLQYVGSIGPTGATGATGGVGPTGPTGPAANSWTTINGNSGTATATAPSETINITGASPITATAANGSPDTLVIDVPVSTNAVRGLQSAKDKLKQDNFWVDVQANPYGTVSPAQTAAQNITGINAILAGAPSGSTIYFPGATYAFNAAWTMPAGKQFVFQGNGTGLAGGNTLLTWTSNVAGTWITLPSSVFYFQFRDLNFVADTATQSAGYVIDVNGNATTNFYNCTFGALNGGFFLNILNGGTTGFNNSWNTSVIEGCNFSAFKGVALDIDSDKCALVMANCLIQGQFGASSGTSGATTQATAGVRIARCGAFQMDDCDLIGAINNMLIAPAVGQVCASVQVANTYFDNSGGSTLKITGAGATVRSSFSQCTFTTAGTLSFTGGGANYSAVEISSTFTYTTNGQNITFNGCNLYNTFNTTGTTNGFLVSANWGDIYFEDCKVAGWTNGHSWATAQASIARPSVKGGTVGASGGYGPNSVGFLIAANTFKGIGIQGCNADANTTPLTLGAITVSAADARAFRIVDNPGINPRGVVTTPAVPATAVAVTNITGFRVLIAYKTTATIHTAFTLNGVNMAPNLQPINTLSYITLEPGGTIMWTGGTAPTWTWVGQ